MTEASGSFGGVLHRRIFWRSWTPDDAPAGWLALASLFFYGWWSPKALPILLGSVAMNYAFSHRVVPASGLGT